MSSSNCCFLTCIQVSQEAGQVVWYSHLCQNFPQLVVIYTVEDFHIVNEAEIDVFLELSCFFDAPADIDNLISGSSEFSKTRLNIWKFSVHVFLKHGLENFEHYFTSVWDECNCVVVSLYILGNVYFKMITTMALTCNSVFADFRYSLRCMVLEFSNMCLYIYYLIVCDNVSK